MTAAFPNLLANDEGEHDSVHERLVRPVETASINQEQITAERFRVDVGLEAKHVKAAVRNVSRAQDIPEAAWNRPTLRQHLRGGPVPEGTAAGVAYSGDRTLPVADDAGRLFVNPAHEQYLYSDNYITLTLGVLPVNIYVARAI